VKRVLVTGASGFIGSHCLEPLLDRGFEVHAASTKEHIDGNRGVHWHRSNLMQPSAAKALLEEVAPTHLLHLAWYVVPGKLITAPENFLWVRASMDLLAEFARQGGTRVVASGSGYEYDWSYGYCSERLTPTVPDTVYGSCKHALSVLLQSFAGSAGLSAAWGRVFFLYGPNEHPQRLVSSVILSLLEDKAAKCSHGRQVRDYLHVQDVAHGLVALLDSDLSGAVNISSGQATTLRDIVLTIGRLMGRLERIQLGAIPARPNDAPLVVGDNSRISTALGWKPTYDLEAGLAQTINWWKANREVTP